VADETSTDGVVHTRDRTADGTPVMTRDRTADGTPVDTTADREPVRR
jgi:hypothetical protein